MNNSMLREIHPTMAAALAPWMPRFSAVCADPRDDLLLEADDAPDPVTDPDDDDLICLSCSGSGEGQYDGTTCYACKGSGVHHG